jgi:hypothetical protein
MAYYAIIVQFTVNNYLETHVYGSVHLLYENIFLIYCSLTSGINTCWLSLAREVDNVLFSLTMS